MFYYSKCFDYITDSYSIHLGYEVIIVARAEQEKRDYTKQDNVMLEQSQMMRNIFETDKIDFTAMYTHLADPFSANWQLEIDSAQALPTSDEDIAELEVKTEAVEAQMELARMQFQKMASYVKLLFPNSKAKQGIFGLNKYIKVYQSQTKMYDLMQLAYRKANLAEYKTDLIALGFVQTEIDALNMIAEALYNANEAQEDFKQEIKLKTEERIVAYNKVWGYMKAASAASKQVYANNYAKQQQYLLYPEGEGGLGKPQNLAVALDPVNINPITLTWDLVPEATSYDVYYDIVETGAPSGNFSLLNNFATSPALIPAIFEKRNYYKIKAKNDTKTSPYSNEIFVDVPAGPA